MCSLKTKNLFEEEHFFLLDLWALWPKIQSKPNLKCGIETPLNGNHGAPQPVAIGSSSLVSKDTHSGIPTKKKN